MGAVPPAEDLEKLAASAWGQAAAKGLGGQGRADEPIDTGDESGSESSNAARPPTAAGPEARRRAALETQRARRRLRRALAVQAGVAPGRSFLEAASITAETRSRYKFAWQEFLAFADEQGLPLRADSEIDEAIVRFMNACFLKGGNAWRGELLLASLLYHFPAFSCSGSRHTPRTFRCLRGWRLLCSAHSRRPAPWAARPECRGPSWHTSPVQPAAGRQ